MTSSLQVKISKKGAIYYAVLHTGGKKYKWINLLLPIKNNKKLAQQKLRELILEYKNKPEERVPIILKGG